MYLFTIVVLLAELIMRTRVQITKGSFYEVKIWKVPKSEFFKEGVKYSMVIIKNGKRIMGYDNERGKSHHKHIGGSEIPYEYNGLETLLSDFEKDVQEYREMKK